LNHKLIGSALSLLGDTPTGDEIESVARASLAAWKSLHPDDGTTLEDLAGELEARCLVWVPSGRILDDARGHREWLTARKPEVEWDFWDRYEAYLERRLNWPRSVVRRLDEVTDDILGRIENPLRDGAWDRRGLVVGRVQSGKTSTYIGLIAKAADAGYRLIVVLAGLHNSLRSQTQVRLDEGFLGFDTQRRFLRNAQTIRIGVGELPGYPLLTVHPLTNSSNSGDFSLRVAQTLNVMPGGAEPVILVVKKNKSILRNLTQWATRLQQVEDPETGRKVVRAVPLLVIDDEADNASVNTAEGAGEVPTDENGMALEEVRPSTINGQIRALLAAFEKKAYVGYTATPFANILSQWNGATTSHGDDLFPRSFIVNLRPPSNYVGPATVFGLARDLGDSTAQEPLPLIREVDDVETWMPTRHKRTLTVGALPASLSEAIRAFLVAAAVRAARGHEPTHNSMLVHVTRFTDVQRQVTELLKDEIHGLRRRLRYGDGESTSACDELEALWLKDFVPTTESMSEDGGSIVWEDVRQHVLDIANAVIVKEVNGTAKDTLDYVETAETGLTVIAVGGDKLSRGLTLEGLTVSYFLRASRMYDTLMQMGRWFGYRTGYGDLCRLYTTPDLIRWYAQITDANEELMQLFDEMVASRQTPETFGLRVRKSPDGLMVTAPSKMRYSKTIRVSFNDSTAETITFPRSDIADNIEATGRFISDLGPEWGVLSVKERPTRVWRHVTPDTIHRFLASYRTHPEAIKADARALDQFITARVADGELIDWTVALVSVEAGRQTRIGDLDIGLVRRQILVEEDSTLTIRRIVSPSDEAIDLSDDERSAALERTVASWREGGRDTREPRVPVGWAVREQRTREPDVTAVFPVVGFAISFPKSGSDKEIEYAANQVYWAAEYAWESEP
jgi:hypothetical protein